LRPANAEELTDTLRRIRLLAGYYYRDCDWDDIREHEARTFLIIPFLIALGWSEQQIKIELGVKDGRIDIAGFRRPYRRDPETRQPNNQDCVLILESKGFSQGLDYAHGQGKEYATQFPKCEVVVASNGYCYKAYRRKTDDTGFEDMPSAYLNLLRPRKSYPLDPGKQNGGLELLSYLMPQRG
jgi:type I site-specific restriction endonuclease